MEVRQLCPTEIVSLIDHSDNKRKLLAYIYWTSKERSNFRKNGRQRLCGILGKMKGKDFMAVKKTSKITRICMKNVHVLSSEDMKNTLLGSWVVSYKFTSSAQFSNKTPVSNPGILVKNTPV